jgi:5-methylcytosine-specific restriction endonuclease McrA
MKTKAEIKKANRAARKGQERPTGQWIRTDARLAVYLRDEFKCVYCGADLHGAAKTDVTLDHVHPYSKGGENTPDNLVTACRSCNCARGARSLAQYADPSTRRAVKRQTARSIRKYRDLARSILEGESFEATCDVWEMEQ